MPDDKSAVAPSGTPAEVWLVFLRLGLTAFGGPVAHIAYFQAEFVTRRKWLDAPAFADLVTLCQFLPGPASSQVGFALGLRRAGPLGALAAFAGFTLPSAVVMTGLAYGVGLMSNRWAQGVVHGLKLVAVAVVAQAVWNMARHLTPDLKRRGIALCAALMVMAVPGALGQVGTMGFGLIAGFMLCRQKSEPGVSSAGALSGRVGWVALAAFFALLVGLPLLSRVVDNAALERFSAFYRSGALVFGGGHVVLPLLQQAVVDPGWIRPDVFLAGYGAAQAMPGPLFTFAAFLGATMPGPPNGIVGALIALAGIFLPGLLMLMGVMPVWSGLRRNAPARAAMSGANAAVVGLLAAALYNPIWTGGVHDPGDVVMAGVGLALLTVCKTPPVVVVCLGALMGVARVIFVG